MSQRKNKTMSTVGTLGLGAVIGVGIAYIGSKIMEYFQQKEEIVEEQPIYPANRPIR